MKIRRATMAVVAAGALVLAGCTSEPDDAGSDNGTAADEAGSDEDTDADSTDDAAATDGAGATDDAAEEGETAKADLGDITTNDDEVSFSTGAEEYNAYNGDTSGTNSTYNAVVNNQLQSGFWYYGTDGTVYPNEWFGSYELLSEEPLSVEYTISDDAVWSDGTPITANDYLLDWASSNPDYLFGEAVADDGAATEDAEEEDAEEAEEPSNAGEFSPVSDTFGLYVPEPLETEPGSKTFTVNYPEPYPDWELVVQDALPSHIVAEQAGLDPDELAQAILDGDGETVNQVAEFWNTGWLFPEYQVTDETLVPSSGPYTLEGAAWTSGSSLSLVPNENFWGPDPATATLTYRFAAPETHVQALQNGDINVIEPQATVDAVQQLQGMAGITLETGDSLTWEHLDYNFGEGSVFSDDEGGLAAREAFAMCVPRQQIVETLIQPINPDAEVMNLREVFPFQEDYQEVLSAAYDGRFDQVDIEGAADKLAEAGVEGTVDIRVGYSAPNQRRTEQVAAIKASCDETGVFNIIDAGDPQFFEAGGSLDTGNWEVALFAWAGSGQIASGRPIYSTDGGQNYGGFSNTEVDEAFDVLATSVDPEVHLEQTKIVEKLLWDNLYGIPIFAHPNVVGYDETLENVRSTAVQTGVSWNAEQWVRAN